MKTVIIQGSSRSKGDTYKINALVQNQLQCDLIDLKSHQIGHYDYEHKNRNDDFIPLIKQITTYDLIIFSTPVYWYSMSGILKTFFDRLSDCLQIEKDTGRKLRGKSMAAISCSGDSIETEGFFIPFKKTAGYLGMNYLGDIHTWIEDGTVNKTVLDTITTFTDSLNTHVNTTSNG